MAAILKIVFFAITRQLIVPFQWNSVSESSFSQNFGNGTNTSVSQNVFFPSTVLASKSDTFRIVSDTLVELRNAILKTCFRLNAGESYTKLHSCTYCLWYRLLRNGNVFRSVCLFVWRQRVLVGHWHDSPSNVAAERRCASQANSAQHTDGGGGLSHWSSRPHHSLLSRRSRQRERLSASVLSICSYMGFSKNPLLDP